MATKPIEAMSLKEIAAEINDNLRRLEAEQNLRKTDGDRNGLGWGNSSKVA